ncbi:MAG: PIN domain-containing protein [Planctomycetota bacterium]
MRFLLDTNVLIRLCHPTRHPEIKQWLQAWIVHAQKVRDVELLISAAADYEARRGYLWKLDNHPDESKALARLDNLCKLLGMCPISGEVLREAAQFWSDARKGGYSTAPERHIDWDVIIAAQAANLTAVVVTSNADHISRYGVDASDWTDIPPPALGPATETEKSE